MRLVPARPMPNRAHSLWKRQPLCPSLVLFGRDRRVGECLLLREERKSGLRGPISVFGHKRHSTSRLPRSRRPSGWSLAHGFPSCATETTVNTTSDTTAFIRPAPLDFGLSGVRLLSVWLAGPFLRTRYSAGARAAPRNYAQWRQADLVRLFLLGSPAGRFRARRCTKSNLNSV